MTSVEQLLFSFFGHDTSFYLHVDMIFFLCSRIFGKIATLQRNLSAYVITWPTLSGPIHSPTCKYKQLKAGIVSSMLTLMQLKIKILKNDTLNALFFVLKKTYDLELTSLTTRATVSLCYVLH